METVIAIVEKLRSDSALLALLPDGASAIANGPLLPGTNTPYVAVQDAGDALAYGFGNSEHYTSGFFDIWSHTRGTATLSPQQEAAAVLKAIREALQNATLDIAGRATICLRYTGALPSSFETMSEEENYLRAGGQWLVQTAPSS